MTKNRLPEWVSKRAEWTPQIAFEALYAVALRDVEDANRLPAELFGGDTFLVNRAAPNAHEFSVVRSNAYNQVVDRVSFKRDGSGILVNNQVALHLQWDYSEGIGKFATATDSFYLGQVVFIALEPLLFPEGQSGAESAGEPKGHDAPGSISDLV